LKDKMFDRPSFISGFKKMIKTAILPEISAGLGSLSSHLPLVTQFNLLEEPNLMYAGLPLMGAAGGGLLGGYIGRFTDRSKAKLRGMSQGAAIGAGLGLGAGGLGALAIAQNPASFSNALIANDMEHAASGLKELIHNFGNPANKICK
jgi:hypothetical protein